MVVVVIEEEVVLVVGGGVVVVVNVWLLCGKLVVLFLWGLVVLVVLVGNVGSGTRL